MGFYVSPQVAVIEKDLTTYIPALPTSITGLVGNFKWGPVNERTLVTNEKELIDYFGKPDSDTYEHFFTAWNFLQYANNLYVVRGAVDVDSTATLSNANILVSTAGTVSSDGEELISSYTDYLVFVDNTVSTYLGSSALGVLAKNPGTEGNRLKVAVAGYTTAASGTIFATTATASSRKQQYWANILPSRLTSDYYNLGLLVYRLKDEFNPATEHAEDAEKYDLVEKFMLSTTASAKDSEGNSIYVDNAINGKSSYIYAFLNTTATFGNVATLSVAATRLQNGANGSYSTGAIQAGYDEFADPEEFDINLIVDGANTNSVVQKYIVQSICESRLDCMAILGPPKAQIVNIASASTQVNNLQNYVQSTLNLNSSYAAFYGNYKYQYDKYNDVYRWVPITGDVAGIYAQTDYTRDPWFAPAGYNRGNVKNVTRLAFSPNLAQRDALYKDNINPIVNFRGNGYVVFGQKTLLTKPSAFDRVDVRRLFLVLEKAISTAAKYFLFEKNTDFTRRQIVGMIEPFLRDVKGREGLYDYLVKCDNTNNTGEVIDRNELVVDIYLKPTKTAEFIVLNFIATRTGVEFSEVGA